MSLLISDAISEMQAELSIIGQRIDDDDFILYLNRANRYFSTNYKMPTAERSADLLIFNGVMEYPLPSDFGSIIEPKRPWGLDSPHFKNNTARELTHNQLTDRRTAIKFNRENAYLLISDKTGEALTIHDCDSVTDNGTWTVTGDGSSLAVDEQIYYEGGASLKFTVTGSGGTTTLTNSTFTSVNLTDYLAHYIFLDLGIPSSVVGSITSVRLRIGSSASNYYQVTSTARYRGDSLLSGNGLIGFDMSTKSTTGTPTDTAINYIQVLITHGTSGINGTYRLDNIFAAVANYYELPYYSKNNVKDDNLTYKEKAQDSADTFLCPPEFEEAYIYKALEIACVEGMKDAALANYFRNELAPKEAALKAKYPTQERMVSGTWYKSSR